MNHTRADSRPLREQVADRVRARITSGELGPGDRLESEQALAASFAVSRHTMRQALQDLTAEGLLTSSRGRGRVVRAYEPLEWHLSGYESRHLHETADTGSDQWDLDVRTQKREPHQDVEVGIVDPPEHIAERLQVGPGELVVVRRRIRMVDGIPFQLANSYFREPLVRGTLLMQPRDVSAPGGLLASIGYPQARYRDEIAIRMPTKSEAATLDLPVGTPVAEVTRTGYAEDGTPLRVMITIAPGDRHTLIYELDAR